MKIQLTPEKKVYNFCEPYIIAEIGANHNGSMSLAKEMIDSAVNCGANAVKFQSWTPDSLVSKGEYDRNQKYNDSEKKHFGSLKEMVTKYYLRDDQHNELKEYCDSKNIDFCSSPFSIKEAQLLDNLGVPFFKIASMDINNYTFLRTVASFGKPMVISTGMSSLGEIENAIRVIEGAGNSNIVLLHCISIYPPLFEDIHLNNITTLQRTFGYPVGFSDHTIGFSIPLASVVLGTCIIEKHFTTDKDLPGWDHEISADPYELDIICRESRNISLSLGSNIRRVSKAEEEKKLKFRRSAVAATDLKRGHLITESDILFKRPGSGIGPDQFDLILGRTINKDLMADELIDLSYLD